MKKIIKQKNLAEWTKNKSIVLTSIKMDASKKKHADRIIIPPTVVADLKRSKNVKDFRQKFIKKYKLIAKLNLDAKAFKAGKCSHVRYFAHPNRVAKMLGKNNFVLDYAEAK